MKNVQESEVEALNAPGVFIGKVNNLVNIGMSPADTIGLWNQEPPEGLIKL